MNIGNDKMTKHLKQTWPAPDEDYLRYNVPDEAMHLYKEEGDKQTFVYSMPDEMLEIIKQIDYEPMVKEDVQEAVDEYLNSIKYTGIDEYGETEYEFAEEDGDDSPMFKYSGELSGYFQPLDRTLELPLFNQEIFTVDFVRHIQLFLKKEYPLWRLRICGTQKDGEEDMIIYPEVVWVGKAQSPPDDLETNLKSWSERINAIRKDDRGPLTRQLEYLKKKLPLAVKQLAEQLKQKDLKPFVVVAAFNGIQGDNTQHCIWMLQIENYITLGPSSPENIGSGERFHVTPEGKMYKGKGRISLGNYYLYQKSFPIDRNVENYHFVISGYGSGGGGREKPDGREWKFQLDAKDIITDAELQKQAKK